MRDHNPGISEAGLFWSLLMTPEGAVSRADGAEMCIADQLIPEFGNFVNAISGAPANVSTISCDATWEATGPEEVLSDDTEQFVFRFRPAESRVHWRASQPGSQFESTDAPQDTLFAAFGREKNGEFF